MFCPCLLAVALSFFVRRGFKFYFASHRLFDILRICLLGTSRARDVASVGTIRQRRRHLGIDAPSNDEICTLCGRHPHFNAPKCEIAALVLTIRRCPPAWRYLFEKGLGADIMAVCSAPMCRRTMKHSVRCARRLLHYETIRHGCCLLGAALTPLLRRRVLFTLRAKSF